MISPVQSNDLSKQSRSSRSQLWWKGFVEMVRLDPAVRYWGSNGCWELWWWKWLDKWMRRWIETVPVRLMKLIWKFIPKTRWCIPKRAIWFFTEEMVGGLQSVIQHELYPFHCRQLINTVFQRYHCWTEHLVVKHTHSSGSTPSYKSCGKGASDRSNLFFQPFSSCNQMYTLFLSTNKYFKLKQQALHDGCKTKQYISTVPLLLSFQLANGASATTNHWQTW